MFKEKTTFYDAECAQTMIEVKVACHSYTTQIGLPVAYRTHTDRPEPLQLDNKVQPIKLAADYLFWISSSLLLTLIVARLIYHKH